MRMRLFYWRTCPPKCAVQRSTPSWPMPSPRRLCLRWTISRLPNERCICCARLSPLITAILLRLWTAAKRTASRESTVHPARAQNQRVVSEFLQAAETGELEPLLKLLSAESALARDAGDLSKPVPPLIHDREILFQTLGNSLAQMRNGSDRFTLLPIGHDYAYVAHCGITAKGAILLRVIEQKVAALRLVTC